MNTKPITLSTLAAMKQGGERIVALTCYDASFCHLLEEAGVQVLLVGDSLGMVIQGQETTIPVSLDDMVYHSACVARARSRALILVDMPFLTYATPERALASAGRLMREGGAHMVKLEGGGPFVATVQRLTTNGVPVCAHLGLLPQSIHCLGGYRYQGRDRASALAILEDAVALQEAGAGLLVLECVPADLAREITCALRIPVIGIGAGNGCDGQVLVLHDLLGLNPRGAPRFSKDFLVGRGGVSEAIAAYVEAVRSGAFPGPDQTAY